MNESTRLTHLPISKTSKGDDTTRKCDRTIDKQDSNAVPKSSQRKNASLSRPRSSQEIACNKRSAYRNPNGHETWLQPEKFRREKLSHQWMI